MATYVVLYNFTDQGIRNVKDTTKRDAAFKEFAKSAGVSFKEMYWTLELGCHHPKTGRLSQKLYEAGSFPIRCEQQINILFSSLKHERFLVRRPRLTGKGK